MIKLRSLLLLSIALLSGCSTTFSPQKNTGANITIKNSETREQRIKAIEHWSINGKIAFIQAQTGKKNKRQSANLSWLYNKQPQLFIQKIDLTTFLGINVLHIESKQDKHLLKVDGKSYHSENLPLLIKQLTGLTLPVTALNYWLKAIRYNKQDTLYFNQVSKLPEKLINDQWQVNYHAYTQVGNYYLPSKLTINHQNLRIKIIINQWHLYS